MRAACLAVLLDSISICFALQPDSKPIHYSVDASGDGHIYDTTDDKDENEESGNEESGRIGSLVNFSDSNTIVLYMSHYGGTHQMLQSTKLADEFGDLARVITTQPFPEVKGSISIEDVSHGFPMEGWSQLSLNPQGGQLLANALVLAWTSRAEYAWIMENDVFFKSGADVRKLVDAYNASSSDYIPIGIFNEFDENTIWPHWQVLDGVFPHDETHQWFGSFAPLMRLSRKLIYHLVKLHETVGHVAFLEATLPTLAKQNDLTVEILNEKFSRHIRWLPCWTSEEILNTTDPIDEGLFFHPVKAENGYIDVQGCDSSSR